jgi:hypothetical protein
MCFNGAKSWFLEWYKEQHITFSAIDQKWEGKLFGQVDYPTFSNGGGVIYTEWRTSQLGYSRLLRHVPLSARDKSYARNYDNADKV